MFSITTHYTLGSSPATTYLKPKMFMNQFAFGNEKSLVKILYEERVLNKRVYYEGRAYLVKSVDEEIMKKKKIFEFSFSRDFLSWDKITDFKIEAKEEFAEVLATVMR